MEEAAETQRPYQERTLNIVPLLLLFIFLFTGLFFHCWSSSCPAIFSTFWKRKLLIVWAVKQELGSLLEKQDVEPRCHVAQTGTIKMPSLAPEKTLALWVVVY